MPEDALIDEDHVSTATSPGYVYLARSTHLTWYERINWPLELKAPARGYYRIGPARITTGDIFGFFPVEREEDSYDTVHHLSAHLLAAGAGAAGRAAVRRAEGP